MWREGIFSLTFNRLNKHLTMNHLNYNHLLYFWTVAREGSIARASEILHITPQTISGQIKVLENSIGAPLFNRSGRGLVLSETGRTVNLYAEEIFCPRRRARAYD